MRLDNLELITHGSVERKGDLVIQPRSQDLLTLIPVGVGVLSPTFINTVLDKLSILEINLIRIPQETSLVISLFIRNRVTQCQVVVKTFMRVGEGPIDLPLILHPPEATLDLIGEASEVPVEVPVEEPVEVPFEVRAGACSRDLKMLVTQKLTSNFV